jgi:hypothetical protein
MKPLSSENITIKWTRGIDLSKLRLTIEDKIFAVQQYYKEHCEHNISGREFASLHCLKQSTFFEWKKKYDNLVEKNVNEFHEGRGRPHLLDAEAFDMIHNAVTDACNQQKALSPTQYEELVMKGIAETKCRRGEAPTGNSCSKEFISGVKKLQEVGVNEVQFKTRARIEAEADPRNAYSMHVLVVAFCEDLSPNLIFNWDATQFVVGFDPASKGVYIKPEKANDKPLTAELAVCNQAVSLP